MPIDPNLNQTNPLPPIQKDEEKTLPVQKPKVRINFTKTYFEEIQKILSELQTKLSTKIFVYYVPEKNMITQEHPDYFLELLRGMEHQEKISLILYSRGGDSMGCIRIASLLRKYCSTFEVILLSSCYSAATQLALAADKIVFSHLGHLGPIDTQLTGIRDPRLTAFNYQQVSFSSFRRSHDLLKEDGDFKDEKGLIETPYRTLFKHIHPLVIAEVDKLSTRSVSTAQIMMRMHPQSFESEEKINWIANHLVFDYPAHDFLIRYEEAERMGLPVEQISEDVTFLLWDLLKLYRAAMKDAVTNIGPGINHTEESQVAIESLGKRVFKNFNYDETYSAAQKKWSIIRARSSWMKIVPSKTQENVPYKIIPIQSEDEEENQGTRENNLQKPITTSPDNKLV